MLYAQLALRQRTPHDELVTMGVGWGRWICPLLPSIGPFERKAAMIFTTAIILSILACIATITICVREFWRLP